MITNATERVHKDRRDAHNLKAMLPYLWEFRGRALLALASLVLAKVATVGVPLALKQIVDAFEQAREYEEIDSALLTDELPPSAYLDRGFHAWLEHASDSPSQ